MIHMTIWVTSRCNLRCPKCNQQNLLGDYDMPKEEFLDFVLSSRSRKIHYDTIELTGGEPTLWPHFKSALQLLQSTSIADWNTFVTNGRDAVHVASIAKTFAPVYGVSATQATKMQLDIHRTINPEIFINESPHRWTPECELPNTHPTVCIIENNRQGRKVLPLGYYNRRIYHCCVARVLSGDEHSVPFESDFISYYNQKPRDQEMCGRCLCNFLVWDQV